jgi:hypothetical protein
MDKPKAELSPTDAALSHPGHYPGVVKKPDKKAVIGETFSQSALEDFLSVMHVQGESKDFGRLRVAYQTMPPEAFDAFLCLVAARGLPLNPKNAKGVSFLSHLDRHPAQSIYAALLRQKLQNT